MAKFRVRPVDVQAVQFRPGQNDAEVLAFLEGCPWQMTGLNINIKIPGIHEALLVTPNDWVIKDPDGAFYACAPDTFAQYYEAVVDGD